MFERLTDRARRVVVLAHDEARMLNHNYIGTEHILLGLIREGEGVAAKALESLGISLEAVRQQVGEIIGQGQQEATLGEGQPVEVFNGQDQQIEEINLQGQQLEEVKGQAQAPSGHIPFTPRAKKVLELSLREALQLDHNHIGTEHILLGLIREGEGVAAQALVKLGAGLSRVRQQVFQLVPKAVIEEAPVVYRALDDFGRNLTQAAREHKLDPVIGREKEIERVMQVLSRRTKNNPVLVGEPGVNKFAVIEGLAQNIVRGDVPENLRDKQLYALDGRSLLTSVLDGSDFEAKLRKAVQDGSIRGDLLLFVDELHVLLRAGAKVAGVDTASIFKPMIARHELQMIGSMTLDDYSNYLEKDGILDGLFQPISVDEPSVAETIEILKGIRDLYEAHHRVSITDAALVAAASLADHFISDRFLPDKAIDLIDEAGSRLWIRRMATPELRELDEQIASIQRMKNSAVDLRDFEEAASLRDRERQLAKQKAERQRQLKASNLDVVMEVDEDLIVQIVAAASNLTASKIRSALPGTGSIEALPAHHSIVDEQVYVLLDDQPVDDADQDLLGAADIAKGIASILNVSRAATPFVLAVDGGWGVGKSTLLHQIESGLPGPPDIVKVRFNAWTAEGENALEGLIKSVLVELDENLLRRWVKRFAKRRRVVGIARLGIVLVARFLGVARLIDELLTRMAVDAQSRNELRSLIHDMLSDWVETNTTRRADRALIVFIDDLDRCTDDVVVSVCEAVKLYLDAPGLIFVIGCDLSVVARGVSESGQRDVSEGHIYLEKIVQVSYRVPIPSKDRVNDLIRGYAQRSGTAALIDETVIDILAERTGRNPRRIKRIINSFVLEHHLNPAWRRPPLGSGQLITAILVQHLYPSFYEWLVSDESGEDSIRDFLDYADVRSKAADPPSAGDAWWSKVSRTFRKHSMPPPERSASERDKERLMSDLKQLEHELPQDFPAFARNEAFVALLRGIGDSPTRMALRSQLINRPLGTEPGSTA
jgi:KAP family P-loop domain/AAA lid domain/Clp amino terminal domain, pathogenicity island component